MAQVQIRSTSDRDEAETQEDLAPSATSNPSGHTSTDDMLAEIDGVLDEVSIDEAEARAAFQAKLRSISFVGTPTTKACDLSHDCSTCSNRC